jgi:hypothetical protein
MQTITTIGFDIAKSVYPSRWRRKRDRAGQPA